MARIFADISTALSRHISGVALTGPYNNSVIKTNSRARCALVGLACAAFAFLWQWLTVSANYKGNWTAFYYTGAELHQPPDLAKENIYTFKKTEGYDGQMYHYIAHDPFFRRGFSGYIDSPRMRYRRILVPLSAYLLALGRDQWIDHAYVAVIFLSIFLGGYWLSVFCAQLGYQPALGVAFLLIPATLISIDRFTVDVALAALSVAFVLYATRESLAPLYLTLVAAALVRETGLLLIAAYAAWLLWKRRFSRAIIFLTAAFPALAWYLFVEINTPPENFSFASRIPFIGFTERVMNPYQYQFSEWISAVSTLLDYVALFGIAAAVALAAWLLWRREFGPVAMCVYAFTAPAAVLNSPGAWAEIYAFGRTLSPLLIFLGLFGISKRNWIYIAPLALVIPRTVIQLAPQAAGVLRNLI